MKNARIQKQYAKKYGIANAKVKFDAVAHSMGGLLTRYFLRYGDADLPGNGNDATITWAVAKDIERAILVATPNGGAVESLNQLFLVASDSSSTDYKISVNKSTGEIRVSAKAPGDGSVPRSSALMDERLGQE